MRAASDEQGDTIDNGSLFYVAEQIACFGENSAGEHTYLYAVETPPPRGTVGRFLIVISSLISAGELPQSRDRVRENITELLCL